MSDPGADMHGHARRGLEALIQPKSVAVVGASSRPETIGGRPVTRLLEQEFAGTIMPINPRHDEIAGLPSYPSVQELPETPDVAIIVVPAREVVASLEACASSGVPAAIVISSGFSELGGEGAEAQASIRALADRSGMAVLGPNCVGVVNYVEGIPLTFGQSGDLAAGRHGNVAVVSQSGALTTCIANRLFDAGVGCNVAVSTGNEAALTATDLLKHLAEDPTTHALVAVLEEVRDGSGLVELAEQLHDLGKPLVLSKVGRTPQGAAAVQSHTGSLAGSHRTLQAVMRRYGVVEATNLDDLVDRAVVAAQGRRLAGDRVAVLTVSGGAGAMAADVAHDLGLQLPTFRPELQRQLAELLPGFAGAVANPIDTTPQALSRPEVAEAIHRAILDDPDVDALVTITPGAAGDRKAAARRQVELMASTDKPIVQVVLSGSDAEPMREPLRRAGVPVYSSPDRALAALAGLHGWYRAAGRRSAAAAGRPVVRLDPSLDLRTEDGAKAALAAFGAEVVDEKVARDRNAAVEAAREIGFPVVVKVRSADISHKTEVDGVRLGLRDEAEVAGAYDDILRCAAERAPDAVVDGVLVSAMVPARLELIAGFDLDPTFGPVIAFGLGGVWAEILDDVALRPAPLDDRDVEDLVDELRAGSVLRGARGLPPVRQDALRRLLFALSDLATSGMEGLVGADVNPVAVTDEGDLVVLDAALYRRS